VNANAVLADHGDGTLNTYNSRAKVHHKPLTRNSRAGLSFKTVIRVLYATVAVALTGVMIGLLQAKRADVSAADAPATWPHVSK
jgi:hypothetical protein